ncbi:MAG: hypothetical protein F4204_10125 [Rhodospirillaceae bacterium]|nr:hypothetical protein [Rhodospirillaceae bacterium]
MIVRCLLAAVLLLLTAMPVGAADRAPDRAQGDSGAAWGGPTTEYAADMVFTDDRGRSRTARLYYTAQRQRLEFASGKEVVAMIYDRAAGRAFQLLLSRRSWRPVDGAAPQFNFGLSDPSSKREKLGEETMAGMAVTKYRVASRSAAGDRFSGLAWATGHRIVVRMEGAVVRGAQKQPLTLVLQNLKIGPVDPALFAVPAGYRKLPPIRN